MNTLCWSRFLPGTQPCVSAAYKLRVLLFLLASLPIGSPIFIAPVWSSQAPNNSAPPKTEKELLLEKQLTSAREKLDAQRWDEAIAEAKKILEIDPNCNAGGLVSGMAYLGKGDRDQATSEFDKALALGPRDTAAIAIRAEILTQKSKMAYDQGEFLQSIDNAYLAILEKGDYVDAHCQRALAYVARQQFDRAIQSADRAIALNDKYAMGYSVRGLARAAKNELDPALEDQNKAINLDPKLAEPYERRGSLLAAKGDFGKALEDIEKSLSLRPNYVDAICDRAFLNGIQNQQTKAFADLDLAIRLNPRFSRAHFLKGTAYLKSEKYEKAIAAFNEFIPLQAKNPTGYCSRAQAYHGLEKYQEAIEDFDHAITLDPKYVPAYQGRAKAFLKLKMPEKAQADSAMAKKLTPEPVKKTAKKKEEPKKKENIPKFVVKNAEVDPAKLPRAKEMAKAIDQFVLSSLRKNGVKPNPKTTDEQFVRRVYLDITGTIPSYPQTLKFLKSDDPDKRSQLIDQLLNSDGYASHFFNYWSDVLRYTDNLNGNVRGEPYRQWIKQSLAENKPWNRMVYEMISAEGLIWENPATGYLQRDANMPLDNMNNTVRIFLGTRIGCAQCHDHPFDKWTQKDFYQIAAFTFGTSTQTHGGDKRFWEANPNDRLRKEFYAIEQEEEERRNNTYRFDRMLTFNQMIVNDQPERKIALPPNYSYTNGKPNEVVAPKVLFGKEVEIKPGEAPRKAFARWMVSKDNPRFALTIANRLWKQTMGIGQIEPVDDMMDSTVAENPELMAYLESQMKGLGFDMKEFLRAIYNSETYQREASRHDIQSGTPYHFPGPTLRRMTAEQVWDSFVTLARPNAYDYRELPSHYRTNALGVNLKEVKAPDVLEAETKAAVIDGRQGGIQQKYAYQGVVVARASELPSPVPANHFLRVFGQSDRELISASSTTGSVPQVLFMFNGPITHMLLEKDSTIYNNIVKKDDIRGGVRALFLTILSRAPSQEESDVAFDEVKRNGAAGYGNVVWSLVNTREFLFIQ